MKRIIIILILLLLIFNRQTGIEENNSLKVINARTSNIQLKIKTLSKIPKINDIIFTEINLEKKSIFFNAKTSIIGISLLLVSYFCFLDEKDSSYGNEIVGTIFGFTGIHLIIISIRF